MDFSFNSSSVLSLLTFSSNLHSQKTISFDCSFKATISISLFLCYHLPIFENGNILSLFFTKYCLHTSSKTLPEILEVKHKHGFKVFIRSVCMETSYYLFWKKWFRRRKLYEKINRPDVRFEAIRKYVKGKNILDFGFGTGYFIRKLANEGFNVTGIDFSQNMKIKRNKSVLLILLRDIKHLNLLEFERKFDTIISSEVLEHLNKNEINKVLRFFSKWLDENGRLILTVPYKEKIEQTILCPYCLKWFHPWLHKQSFNERNIQELIRKHGFLVEKIKYISVFDFMKLPSLVRNFINPLLSHFSGRGRIWMVVIAKKV